MNIRSEWIGFGKRDNWPAINRLKGVAISSRYPVVKMWAKSDFLDILEAKHFAQLIYYDQTPGEPEWEGIWKILPEYMKEWEEERQYVDEEEEMIWDEDCEQLLPKIFGDD